MKSRHPPSRHPARCPMERLLIPQGVPSRPSRQPYARRAREYGWDVSLVTVAFGDCSAVEVHSSVSIAEAQAAILRAIETWNRINLPTQFLADPQNRLAHEASVHVEWRFSSHDPEQVLGGQVHAHADYPPPNTLYGGPPLPLHFNADLLWGIEQSGCYDIETVALHELAHILGLVYHSGPDTVLYDAIGPAPVFVQHGLDSETVQRAKQLYLR